MDIVAYTSEGVRGGTHDISRGDCVCSVVHHCPYCPAGVCITVTRVGAWYCVCRCITVTRVGAWYCRRVDRVIHSEICISGIVVSV